MDSSDSALASNNFNFDDHQQYCQPHFVLIPLMAPGHMIPLVDMAELLAQHGGGEVVISLVTTPVNAARIDQTIRRFADEFPQIRLVVLPLPCSEVGLPEGCENVDLLPSKEEFPRFIRAAAMLRGPLERHLRAQHPPPSCVIADFAHPWADSLARDLKVRRFVFHGFGVFPHLCWHNLHETQAHEAVTSNSELFLIPGLPGGHRVEVTRAQLPGIFQSPAAAPYENDPENQRKRKELYRQIREGELAADGVVINSFDALEPKSILAYKAATGKKVWTVGPFFLLRQPSLTTNRGNGSSIDERRCLEWLGSHKPHSVVYASFGSLARLSPRKLQEVGLGLEESSWPFVLVVKAAATAEMEWLAEVEQRMGPERSLIIRGWAPQLLILSHPSTGAFLTHCGWNSIMEGVSSGVPFITWPLFGEQFLNEKMLVGELGIAVSLGAKEPTMWGDKDAVGVQVTREAVAEAVEKVMGDTNEEAERRRSKVKELGMLAREALEVGGTSYCNLMDLIRHVAT